LVLGLFLVGVGVDVAVLIYRHHNGSEKTAALTSFFGWLAVLVAGLFVVCFVTGERPRWRWGD
jgi:hypothetical protein